MKIRADISPLPQHQVIFTPCAIQDPKGKHRNQPVFSSDPILISSEFPDSQDGQEFGGSIYQRINSKLESAIQLAWSSGSNNTKFGIGAKYDLDQDAALRAKVDNSSLVGLGYQQRLRDGKGECKRENSICSNVFNI